MAADGTAAVEFDASLRVRASALLRRCENLFGAVPWAVRDVPRNVDGHRDGDLLSSWCDFRRRSGLWARQSRGTVLVMRIDGRIAARKP